MPIGMLQKLKITSTSADTCDNLRVKKRQTNVIASKCKMQKNTRKDGIITEILKSEKIFRNYYHSHLPSEYWRQIPQIFSLRIVILFY